MPIAPNRSDPTDELDETDETDHIGLRRRDMAVAKKKSGHSGKPRRRVVSLGLPQKGATETAKEVVKISKSKVVKRIVAGKSATKGVMSGLTRAVRWVARNGKPVQMTVIIEPDATAPRIAVEELAPSAARDELDIALSAAKTRGAARVADILNGADMLTADAFAEEIGATRETVHKKRRRREVLGLEGPKRGVRFPKWQLNRSGELLVGLPQLFEALGDHPWTVYRFLLQAHPELDGATGLAALRAGRIEEVIGVAGSVGAGAFA